MCSTTGAAWGRTVASHRLFSPQRVRKVSLHKPIEWDTNAYVMLDLSDCPRRKSSNEQAGGAHAIYEASVTLMSELAG